MRSARARARAARSSSTRVRPAEITVTMAKKPTTTHAQTTYEDGKRVSATVTAATTTSAARSRTSHCPWRLGNMTLLRGEVVRRDARVPLQEPSVVARDVEARVSAPQLGRVGAEPVREGDVRLGAVRERLAGPAFLDAAVPRAYVLADVASVHLRTEVRAELLGRRLGRLRPVREAPRRVEHARLVERVRRARVDAEATFAAIRIERRRELELGVGDQRPEHDPRAVPARDEERVFAVETDSAAGSGFAIDVLVRIDEDAVRAADAPTELVELLPEDGVGVEPRVARQATVTRGPFGLGKPVAERRRNDRARIREERLGMARLLGPRHREAHVGKEAASASLADVTLGLDVRLSTRSADRIEPELGGESMQFLSSHTDSLPRCAQCGSMKTGVPTCSCSKRCRIPSPGQAKSSSG